MLNFRKSGMDITVLLLCEMLNLKALILLNNYMWKSAEGDASDFDIFMLLFTSGRFISASPRSKVKIKLKVPDFAQDMIAAAPINVTIGAPVTMPISTSVKSTKKTVLKSDSIPIHRDHFAGILNNNKMIK